MDNEITTARTLCKSYCINGDTFEKAYKEVISDFKDWKQKEHAEDWVLLEQNIGEDLGIDETSIGKEVYTIVHNKDAKGKKGAIVAIVKGIYPPDVLRVLQSIDIAEREKVKSITMDLSDSMHAIASQAFTKATIIRDCFHVMKRAGEGIEEVRLRLKREAVKQLKKAIAEHKKKLARLATNRKRYKERQALKGKKRRKGKKRGRKPMKANTRFVPEKLSNGETEIEALTKCSKQLQTSQDKWSDKQKERLKLLFDKYPKLKEAYELTNSLRAIFRNKTLDKAKAEVKLKEWYAKVTACTLREVKSVRDTIKHYEDQILNYFIDRKTNASAESLNSKIKAFRSQLRGVRDVTFFMYRVVTVLG